MWGERDRAGERKRLEVGWERVTTRGETLRDRRGLEEQRANGELVAKGPREGWQTSMGGRAVARRPENEGRWCLLEGRWIAGSVLGMGWENED
ncbi:hypothetical protein ACH5RR_015730 [Cinchona calisaya]|uniref:Uncharacterized protein n=1 Tax=Cinchona calisaya TaxID=153742 RepID=A0ABD2ZVX1_9GENT